MKKVLLQEIADIKVCIVGLSKNKDISHSCSWIVLSSLLPNNQIGTLLLSSEYQAEDELKAKVGDILIRRLSPTEVNYIDSEIDAYVYNNIVIVRAKEDINSQYLAAYMDANIADFVKLQASGSVAMSIGKKDLGQMEVFLPDDKTQECIGNYWLLSKQKRQLQQRLFQLEDIQNKEIINSIKDKTGV